MHGFSSAPAEDSAGQKPLNKSILVLLTEGYQQCRQSFFGHNNGRHFRMQEKCSGLLN
jgi:hypothetical protein